MQQYSKQGDTTQGDTKRCDTRQGNTQWSDSKQGDDEAKSWTQAPVIHTPVDRDTVQVLLSMLQSYQIDTQREAGSALVALAFHPWHRSTLRDLEVPDRAQHVLNQTTDREVKRLMSALLRHMVMGVSDVHVKG
jgi:hypothetical protein